MCKETRKKQLRNRQEGGGEERERKDLNVYISMCCKKGEKENGNSCVEYRAGVLQK